MKRLTLTHIYEELEDQALGVLQMLGSSEAIFTNEPGLDEENPRLPDGTYLAKWTESPTYGWTWTLIGDGVSAEPESGVPRNQIRIHWGNRDEDSKGCPLTGLYIGWMGGEPAMMESKRAFRKLKDWVAGEDFLLIVRSGSLTAFGG